MYLIALSKYLLHLSTVQSSCSSVDGFARVKMQMSPHCYINVTRNVTKVTNINKYQLRT